VFSKNIFTGSCEETDKVLRELRDTLGELETHVSQMSKFLEEEKAAIEGTKVCFFS